jgi:protein SCO1/2
MLSGVVACQKHPGKQLFIGYGVVKNVAGKTIRIEHEDIPGFMQAMTMEFEVKDPTILAGIQPEEAVEFTLERTADSIYVTGLNRMQNKDLLFSQEATATEPSEKVVPEIAKEEFSPYPAANFTLTDQDGQSLTLSDLSGKIILLDFIFTRCPGPCPLLSLKFSQLQQKLGDRLGKEIVLISVTIDPRHDTPEVLKEYARRYQANLSGWKFLTGSTKDIVLTTAAYGAEYQANQDGIVDHRLLACLIDREGNVVQEFTGTNYTVDDLLKAIERLHEHS